MWRAHLSASPNFFPPVESVSRRQSVDGFVSVVNTRQIVNYCKIMEWFEQRYCIKFCQMLGDTQVETIRKIQQAFRDDAMSITRIKEWYNRFKDGSTLVDSEPRHGRPSTSRNDNVINQVRTLLMQDRCITVRELADEVGVSIGSVHTILTADFGLRRVSAKFVPKLLMMEQKQLRLEIAQDMLECVESDSNFLNIVITGDESWVYGYDPETKAQCTHNGNIHHPRGQRKHGRSPTTSRLCWPFFFLTPVGWCITNTHHKAKPSPKSTTRGYFVAFVMLCGANDRTCGQQNLGSSITTMHLPILRIWFKVFWLNTTFPWFVRLPNLPTWPLVIFGCSPNWKCRWKGPDLSQEKTLCGTRQPTWTWFHKKLSRNVSSNGRTAGRSVCITKETTL